MWSTLIIVIAGAAACIGVLLARALISRRSRSAGWDDLHERGKLFTAQLSHLKEIEARKAVGKPSEAPHGKPLKDIALLLPRRATLERRSGSSSAALDPIVRR